MHGPAAILQPIPVRFDAKTLPDGTRRPAQPDRPRSQGIRLARRSACARAAAAVLHFAQHPALGRKVSDEFTVPLCRGHHRELHRSGDEGDWWKKAGIDPTVQARALWLQTHPLPLISDKVEVEDPLATTGLAQKASERHRSSGERRSINRKSKPITPAGLQ